MMRVQGGRQRSPWRPPRSGRAAFPGTQAPPPCTSRPMPAFTASEVTLPSGVFRERNRRVPAGPDAATSTPTPEQMTPLCPLPALGYCFLPPLLRSVPRVACSARPRAQAAGLSWPGPPLHPAPLGAALLQPLSSARCLGRGRRGASNDGAHTGRTRFPRLGEVGGAASGPWRRASGSGAPPAVGARGGGSARGPPGAAASPFGPPNGGGACFLVCVSG